MARKFFPILVLAVVFGFIFVPDNFDPESISGKRVLITGVDGSSIGQQLAYQYCKLGAAVVISGHSEEALKEIGSKCREHGAKTVDFVVADMGRPQDRNKIVDDTEKHLGGLDHLILNHDHINSGFWTGSAHNMSQLRQELEVNFVSYVELASKLLQMLSASNGNIGVVSPLASKIGFPTLSSFTAGKFAVHGFFSALRQELKVNNVDVSITFCVIGSLDDHNMVSKWFHFLSFVPSLSALEEAANSILIGVAVRSYEVQFPKFSSFLLKAHTFLPEYSERYLALRNSPIES